jgi:hypothetical protein
VTGTKTRLLIFLVVLAAFIYIGWNLVPPYFANSQFQDSLDDIVRRTTYSQHSDEDIKSLVIHKAESMDIPIKEDQVTVTRTSDGVGITVNYRVHVNLIVHPMDLDFTANSRNRRI